MKVKCPKCGFEDEGNFCSNCGSPLPNIKEVTSLKNLDVSKEKSWLDKCPVCKSNKLNVIYKKIFFGLINLKQITCNKCGSVFTPKGEKYKLAKVKDKNNLVWKEYGKQILNDYEWKRISEGGMSDEKQKEVDIENWLIELKEGKVYFNIGESPTVILKKKEKPYVVLSNISLLEPRKIRTGGYGGPSFRVAKGVYFRVGGFKAESHEEIREIDTGTLTITNKRLIFSGSKKTINVDLRKIVSIEPYKDGIGLRREGREKIQYLIGINKESIIIKVEDRTYQEPFSGLILMYLVEGLVKNMD